MSRPIALVGFMGSGKSTVAPLLARRLGWSCVDLDAEIERGERRSIAEIFATDGESHFRELERHALSALIEADGARTVIATGGGAFAHSSTRSLLLANTTTVWLRCGFATCWERAGAGDRRPLARDRATMAELFRRRRAIYAAAAWSVDGDLAAPESVAATIAARVGGRDRGERATS